MGSKVQGEKKTAFRRRRSFCATDEIRTHDTRIFSPLLYRLSYSGNCLSILLKKLFSVNSSGKKIFPCEIVLVFFKWG